MKKRLDKLRQQMAQKKLAAFLVTSRQNCFYLTNFTGTTAMVLLTPVANYFITDYRYTDQAYQEVKDCRIIGVKNQFVDKIKELLTKDEVYQLGFEAKQVTYYNYQQYREKFNQQELQAVEDLVETLRLIKDKEEITKIKKAITITEKAFLHILDYLKPGIKEIDVARELEFFMKKAGGSRNSFEFIVASGVRSALPHGVATNKKLQSGDFITLDFGTIYQGYCSDMTRTVVLGKPSARQCAVYEVVLKAHREVVAAIKAGMSCQEVDGLARKIIKKNGYQKNFKHGLGHGLGLKIHENPRLHYKSDEILQPGMVVTNEPGIYISGWGGVRIEDVLLITENGCQVLNNTTKDLLVV